MIVDSFNKIVGINVSRFISDYSLFVSNNLNSIINYYTGTVSDPDLKSFNVLNDLISRAKEINESIAINHRRFDVAEYWTVVEAIDNIITALDTAYNTSRWVRSTIANGDFNTNLESEVVLPQNNTLENLAKSSGYEDSANSWVRIAMRNDLDEDKYTLDGGNVLRINMLGRASIEIDDVIDNISGDNMYGKDIRRKFSYVNDDIDTVVGESCMLQCYEILIGLTKGDIPEFEDMGLSGGVGNNVSSFSYPLTLRQIHRTFYRDASVESVTMSELEINQDIVTASIIIQNKFGSFLRKGVLT